MSNKQKLVAAGACVLIVLGLLLGYSYRSSRDAGAGRAELFSLVPTNGNVAVFLDLSALHTSPFLGQLLGLAPQPAPDSDYLQFLQATGFNYERDLDRVASSIDRQPQSQTVFAIAEG